MMKCGLEWFFRLCAEQFVGQQLRCIPRALEEPRLFYWQRTNGCQGEIDYIIQNGMRIVPIEVKAPLCGEVKRSSGPLFCVSTALLTLPLINENLIQVN